MDNTENFTNRHSLDVLTHLLSSTNNPHVNGNGVNDHDTNGNHANGQEGNGNHSHEYTDNNYPNGSLPTAADSTNPSLIPIAICGMACRLPGGIDSPDALWDFLISKSDARTRVPETRYKISAYHSDKNKPGMTVSEYGYFLDPSVDLQALDTSFFSMAKSEVERLDPQQKLLLEVSREALDDAGEVKWRGQNIGVYVGSFGQDWYDLSVQDPQKYGMYQVTV